MSEPPSDEALRYHRLARAQRRTSQWWRPLATFGAFVGVTLLVSLTLGVTIGIAYEVWPLPSVSESMEDGRNPADIFFAFGSIAAFLPVVLIAAIIGAGRIGTLNSVIGRFRWGLLARAARVVVPLFLALNVGSFFLLAERGTDYTVPALSASIVAVYVIGTVFVPIQSAAEEYAFRGLLPQMLGTWLRSPLWGVLVSTPLFVLSHGYDPVGLIDIAVFALCMHFLTWKSGGLELGVLVHACNNWTLTLVAPLMPDALHQGAVAPASVVISVVEMLLITAGLAWWVSRREGLRFLQPLTRPAGAARI